MRKVYTINGSLRQKESSILSLAQRIVYFVLLFFCFSVTSVFGLANGDYRSIATGNWNSISTWEKYNGTYWVAAVATPTYSDKVITIQNSHTVTVTANVSIDEAVIALGGTVIVNSGVTLTIKKATIPDLEVYGKFKNGGTVTITSGTNIEYFSGGYYQHNYTTTAGTIPVGTWDAGSTCEIVGYTTNTSMPSGMGQSFSDFVWNCSSQSVNVNFANSLTSFTGNFIVANTGSGELQFANNNITLSITGSLSSTGGILTMNNTASKSTTLNISGNLSVTGGTMNVSSGNSCTGTINLTGDYSQSAGVFNFGTGSSASATINASGNWSHTGGTITAGGSGSSGQITFNKTGTQTFTASGNTVSGTVNYTVNSGSIFNSGTSVILGNNFTLSSGAEIGIGSSGGITSSGLEGNIQVLGTRTYNSGAYYTYNGTGNQLSGNGLPSTINKLTINNGANVTLTNSVSVSNILTLTNGKIVTGAYEVHVTNTSGSAITGQSTTSYVNGNLRRTITTSGTFAFPVGSSSNYELMSTTLASTKGFTTMVASFSNTDPNDPAYPMTESVNGNDVTAMLNAGYWTLSPNSSLTGGTYSVTLNARGHSNSISIGRFYAVLVRNNAASSWQSTGTHADNTQSESGGTVTAVRSGYNSFFQYGIGYGEYPQFSNGTLTSGTDGAIGAIYVFPDVLNNVDAWVELVNIYNGAVLSSIDNNGTGYSDCFQPFVSYPPELESYIEWRIRFKKADTSTDTTISKVMATGVDVDGGYADVNNNIREFVIATMPQSYSLDASTLLTMSNDSGRYKAVSPTSGITNIDSAHHEVMYQLNYVNVNTLLYRTGAINNYSTSQTRQTSLYFKAFLSGSPIYALPINLVEFNARLNDKKVNIDWITASELKNDYFSVERSEDGISFESIVQIHGAGTSSIYHYYETTDEHPLEGQSYYRLKQTDYDGKYTFSNTRTVYMNSNPEKDGLKVKYVAPNPFGSDIEIEFSTIEKSNVEITLMSACGKIIDKAKIKVIEGKNRYRFYENHELNSGTYFVIVEQNENRITNKILKE